jgi:hypothetical protein
MLSRPGRKGGGRYPGRVTELGAFLLPVVPLLGLLAFLLLGRYPGCEAIVQLSERLAKGSKSRRDTVAAAALPKSPRSSAPSGGLLIALGLAQRPPPPTA